MTNHAFSKTDILDILHSNVAEVTFEKSNGDERIMVCTLNESHLPTRQATALSTKARNNDVIAAYDLANKGWRSFRIDSVKAIVYPKQWSR